jgi:hypothetical protein
MPDELIEVVAYSGYRVEERPRLFITRGEQIEVKGILNMWIEENVKTKKRKRFFRVRGSDGHEYTIYYDEEMMLWFLTKE